jgi:hypothetical protein
MRTQYHPRAFTGAKNPFSTWQEYLPLPSPVRTAAGPPAHLAAEEAALYGQIARNYGLRDEVSLRILEEACSSVSVATAKAVAPGVSVTWSSRLAARWRRQR